MIEAITFLAFCLFISTVKFVNTRRAVHPFISNIMPTGKNMVTVVEGISKIAMLATDENFSEHYLSDEAVQEALPAIQIMFGPFYSPNFGTSVERVMVYINCSNIVCMGICYFSVWPFILVFYETIQTQILLVVVILLASINLSLIIFFERKLRRIGRVGFQIKHTMRRYIIMPHNRHLVDLEPGDEVLEIDGTMVEELSQDDIDAKLRGTEEIFKQVTLTIKRSGEGLKTVTMSNLSHDNDKWMRPTGA